jgi:hypothetical protein
MPVDDGSLPEPDFTPEEFDQTKYTDHFPALQAAYKMAFETVNEEYDSELVHAIDQQVLNESEPFYRGEGTFELEIPEEPVARVAAAGVIADGDRVETVLDAYVSAIEDALREQFARGN